MSAADDPLTGARRLVERVLSGEVTYEAHPEVFDDDGLLFSIWRLEGEDPEWLLAQFGDSRWPLESRENLVGALAQLGDDARSRLAKAGESTRDQ